MNDSPSQGLTANEALKESIFEKLRGHSFLKGFREEDLKQLAAQGVPVEFATNQVIFEEGSSANRFYLVIEGSVSLEAFGKDGKSEPIQEVPSGSVLGWSWMFPPFVWTFDAIAKEPTKAICFYGKQLLEDCERDPALGYALAKRMAGVAVERLHSARRKLLSKA